MKPLASSLAIAALAILPASPLHAARWYWMNPMPTGEGLGGIQFVSASEGWATTLAGRLLHTTDGGTHWSLATPDPGTRLMFVDQPLNVMHFLSASTGWVSGTLGSLGAPLGARLYRTTDGGGTWSPLDLPGTTYGGSVHFVDPARGWLVTGTGVFPNLTARIQRSGDGGATWSAPAYQSGIRSFIVGLSFVDSLWGWAAQDSFVDRNGPPQTAPAVLLRTTDGGLSWAPIFRDTAIAIDGIRFFDRNVGWAVGSQGTVMRTTDGGLTWTPRHAGLPACGRVAAFHFLDGFRGWVMLSGAPCTTQSLYYTADAGLTWQLRGAPQPYNVSSMYFRNAVTGWVAGETGELDRTDTGGATWKPQVHRVTDRHLTSACATAGGRHLWAVGRSGDGLGGSILRSRNGGASWEVQTGCIGGLGAVDAVACADSARAIAGGGWGIVVTSDGGACWRPAAPHAVSGLAFAGPSVAVAVGWFSAIYRSADGGETWGPVASPTSAHLNAVRFRTPSVGYAVGDNGTILRSGNGGASWLPLASGVSESLRDIAFGTALAGIAVGDRGTVVATGNGGLDWAPLTGVTPEWLNAVQFTDASHVWIGGYSSTLLHSADGGASWSSPEMPFDGRQQVLALAFSDSVTGVIVGADGMIVGSDALPWAGVEERRSGPWAGARLGPGAPNPFVRSTLIRFGLAQAGHATLKIYDLRGAEVETLVDGERPAGEYEVLWRPRGLAPGVYFYRLRAGGREEARRLVLL